MRFQTLALLAALCFTTGAVAQDYRYDLYVDTDRDLGTGCSVVTPDGSVSGAEVRVSAEVSGTTVGAVTASECAGGVFGAGSALGGPHAVGLNTGTAGADVVEFSAPRSVFGGSSLLQLLLASSNAGGTAGDVLLTTTGQPGGGPILLGFASVPIPLFGLGGVVLLVVAVFFVARRRLRLVLASLGALLVAGAVWAANFVVDGQIGDWSGVSALALDPAGDGTGGDSGTDVRALFAADENGTVFFRVDVADLENQLPVVNPASALFLEDGAAQTIVLTGSDGDGEPLTFAIATGPTRGTLSAITPINATSASVDYTPNGNANGADSFTVIANDGVGNSAPATVSITITPVNDVPAFTRGADVSLLKDSGAQSIAAWATGISAGPADESGQALSFTTTVTSNPGLFQVAPSVAANGTLSFTPAADQNGSATVDLFLMDNGGTTNGGVDTSAVQSFTISFQAVNDPPSFTKGADQTVLEDAAAQTVAGWATAISPGPADEAGQTVSFTVMNDNAALFSVPPAVASDGTLSYSLAANANGSSTLSVVAQDNGGTANGGINVSAAQTFAINVTAVNDEPSFTAQNPAAVGEDSGAQTAVVATALSAGPADESAQTFSFSISSNTNPGLLNPGASIDAGGTLSFTPAPDQTGSTDLSVVLTDNGGTANGGDDTSTTQIVTITVNPLVPDLVLSKSEGGTGSAPGGTIHYSLGVQNVGLDNALGVTLSETVPANSTFNPGSSTPGWTCAPDNTAGSACSFSIGAIAAGASAAANTFAVSVIDPIPAGVDQISNSASVVDDGSSGADPTPANNSASDSTPITAQPELRLSTTDGGASTVPGATLSYTLAYGNDGDQGATGVVISAAVPTHSTFNPGSSTPGWTCAPDNNAGSTCSLAIGGLAGGASGSANFAVSVDATVAAGVTQLSHSASIADDASNGADPILINNSGSDITPISAQPDLALTKSDGGASTIGGGSVVYTLGASNAGNQGATGVRINESVPAETTFNAASSTAGWSCANGATAGTACNFNLGALAAGASQNISFAVNVNVGTVALQISNTATVADDGANGSDPNPANNSASDTTPIDAAPAVQSTTPGEGATVGNTQALTINFSEQVDVGVGLSLSCSAGAVALSNTTGSNVASISPSYVGALPSGPCTLSLPAAAVTDVDAIDPPNQMAAPFTLNFTVDAAPTVTSSTPANGTSNVAVNSAITINFSEPVLIGSAGDFAVECPMVQGFTVTTPAALPATTSTVVLDPMVDLPATSTCTVRVFATVTDADVADPPDAMAADHTFSFTTVDVAPTVTGTNPGEGNPISAASDLSVTFSEAVNFSTSSFALNCGGARSFAVSGSGSNTATINPDSNLPLGACSLTVQSSVVNGPTDVDVIDPPDALAAPFVLNFTATNAAPVLSIGATTSVGFTEDGAAVVMVPTATASDPDGTTLASATATITGNHQSGEDVLSFTNTPNISGSFVAATGTLSLVGVDSLANYQAALRSITYSNTSNTPNTSNRTISWVGNDGIDNSVVVQSTITVSALDDAPTANNLTPAAFNEDTQSLITLSYSDPEGDLATTCAITAPSNVTVTQACACAAGVCTVGVTGTANTSGAASFNYTVTANSAVSNSASATLSINPINDAPAGTDGSATLIEDGSHVFTAVNFGFTDPNDTPPNTLLSVTLTTVPSLGSLRLSGTPQAAGAVISVADINGGLLTFEPVAAGSGTPYTSFTFQVRDNGGTANGGIDLDASANTFTLNVTPINDPPAGTDNTVSTPEDVAYSFAAIDFGFSDPNDTPPNTLSQVRITTTPALGSLTLSGVPVAAGADINLADITAGNLRYQGDANAFASPYSSFTFQVRDNGGTAGGGIDLDQSANTMTLNVTPVNDAPVADNDSFDFIGNTELAVDLAAPATPATLETTPSTFGVMDGDNDPVEGDSIVIRSITVGACTDLSAPFDCNDPAVGTVNMQSNGRFRFTPVPGDTGATETFTYTVIDNGTPTPAISAPATVTLTRFERVWYINPSAGAGTGTSSSPLNSLTSLNGAGGAGDPDLTGDYFFVHNNGTLTGGLELEANQHLLGEGVGLSLPVNLNANGSPTLLVAAGTAPTWNNSGGNTVSVTCAVPIEIRGLSLASTAGNAIDWTCAAALTGSATLTASNNSVRGASAEGLDVNWNASTTGTAALAFTNNNWVAGTHTGNAVDINNASAANLNVDFSNNTNIVSSASGLVTADSGGGTTTITGFTGNSFSGDIGGNGISLNTVVFDATPGGTFQQVSGGNTQVGASGNAVGQSGMTMTSVTGDLAFTDLDIFSGAGSALVASSSGAFSAAGTGFRLLADVGTPEIDAVGGAAVNITNATVTLLPNRIRSLNSTGLGFMLDNVQGTFTTGAGVSSISGAASQAFVIANGTANVSYNGTITSSTVQPVSISGKTAGTVTLSGPVSTTGLGIVLLNNTGATINFTGGVTASTGTAAAFSATGGGTFSVTGAANTLATTTGTALNVENTTIGASGLTFRSISSNGAANGIVLNTTGVLAGLTVTGTGAAASGGTINAASGGDGAVAGNGVYLSSARNVSLSFMHIAGSQNNGVYGDELTNFSLINSQVTGSGTNTANEAGLRFDELFGTCSVTNTTVSGSVANQIYMTPASGVLTNLTISGSTIGEPPSPVVAGGNGISVVSSGTANTTVTIQNSTIQNNFASGYLTTIGGTGAHTVSITGTMFRDNNIGFDFGNGPNSDVTASLTNNTFLRHAGSAMNLVSDANATTSAQYNLSIDGNAIGDATIDSGSRNSYGIAGDMRGDVDVITSINNNNIRHADFQSLFLQSRVNLTASGSRYDIRLRDNSMTDLDDNSAFPFGTSIGTLIESRNVSDLCLDIAGNTSIGVGGAVGFRTRQRDTAIFRAERLALGAQNAATMGPFVAGQNDAGSTADALTAVSFTGVANGACRTP